MLCVCALGHVLTARQPTCDCLTGRHPTLEKVELPRLQHCSMQCAEHPSRHAALQRSVNQILKYTPHDSLIAVFSPSSSTSLENRSHPIFEEWQFCANLYFKTWIGSKLHTLVPLNVKSNVIVSPSNFALSCHHGLFNDQ